MQFVGREGPAIIAAPPRARDEAEMAEAEMTLTVPVIRESAVEAGAGIIATDIPARLDRLRWGRFHTLVVVALGITWILDGLEVTLAGAVSPALKESPQLRFSNADVGLVSSAYLAGAVMGAVFFGWLTDRFGRK
jgi:fucose permease